MTTQISDLIEALKGIGLNENEAGVYIAALELGPSSVWDISKKARVKRPTCYVILDEMVFRGYASKTHDGKRAIFSVLSPKQLAYRLQKRQESFRNFLTQFEAIQSRIPQKPNIRLFEGIEGIKQAYLLTLEQPRNSEILIYGTAAVKTLLSEFINNYLNERVKKKIRVRAILADIPQNREVLKLDKKELRQTKFLPKEKFDPNLEINIFGDTIIYIAHSEKQPFATVIESATIVKTEKEIFELVWQNSKM